FLSAGGSEDSVDSAKKLMFWGVIIIFVMVSFWGIVQFFYSDFFDGRAGIPVLPEGDPARDIDITNDSF
ncbi:MAG: hypothetical protein MRY49_01680, partial [Candidatus Pacebacteria bacterium]|nr:hypothetical protein [Candidatus Paceibacterota bacterium]